MMLSIKYESSGPCSFRQEDFWKLHFENLFWPRDLLMQRTETVWATLVEDHPRIIPVKFGQNPMSGFREEVVWLKTFTHALTNWRTKDKGLSCDFVLRWAKNRSLGILFECTPTETNYRNLSSHALYNEITRFVRNTYFIYTAMASAYSIVQLTGESRWGWGQPPLPPSFWRPRTYDFLRTKRYFFSLYSLASPAIHFKPHVNINRAKHVKIIYTSNVNTFKHPPHTPL